MASQQAPTWRISMSRKILGHLDANNFAAMEEYQSSVDNVIDSMWVFDLKKGELGHIVKFKTRLVARRFKRREGIGFGEPFASTVSGTCVCLLTAIACVLDLGLCHFDVQQAFVLSNLKYDAFMRMPKDCGSLSGKVVRLNEILYCLKQALRSWHAHPTAFLKESGFPQCLAGACIFRMIEEGRVAITAVIHVDDILAAGCKSRCDRFCEDLGRMVPVKNLGELSSYGRLPIYKGPAERFVEQLAEDFWRFFSGKVWCRYRKEYSNACGIKYEGVRQG